MAYAHSKNGSGHRQDLIEHLIQVAEGAARFAQPFQASELAYCAGLLHDIGKFDPEFQTYLLSAEDNPQARRRGPDHKGAGALLASTKGIEPLAFLVKGHHGGLPSAQELKSWLRERGANPVVQAAIASAQIALPELNTSPTTTLPEDIHTPHEAELFIRLLFSALVDADFLDTERHFAAAKQQDRGYTAALPDLWQRFERDQQSRFATSPATPVNVTRDRVYRACIEAAALAPGFFRLTVPTGGAKTRSSLAFGLRHAIEHGLGRILYAIPYTSITEQTAGEFRSIFLGEHIVLEHHSATAGRENQVNPLPAEIWARLAAENWDAPLIVTTTVRLFESLMANAPSACRRLHNVARSVIILDEAQMLPTHVLTPILSVLDQLVTHYGVSVVLCTATQPALDERVGFPGLRNVREIAPNPKHLFATLKRVRYLAPAKGERWSWDAVAERMRESDQALTIVNTRANAAALLTQLQDPDALHLSTWMCGAHRRAVIEDVRARLKVGAPCCLVATQLIEAGVDVDFPLVMRAMGPLDRIVQAAGRCNREGRLEMGTVIIFEPEEGNLPPGAYQTGTELTRDLIAQADFDFHNPDVYREYFERYYRKINPDDGGIQKLREMLDYPAVAERFHLIADDTTPVVVHYKPDGASDPAQELLDALRRDPSRARDLLRRLQPYTVGLRDRDLKRAVQHGLAIEMKEVPGIYEWVGQYDSVRGIVPEGNIDPEGLVW